MTYLQKIATLSAAASIALGGAAFAGNLEVPAAEAPITLPAPVISADWTGFYTGLQLGYGDVNSDSGLLNGSSGLYGFHAGYDFDFGTFVLGAELDYDNGDIGLGGVAGNIDSIARLKVRGGYDFGDTLLYATAGAARADTSFGDETGPFLGIGATYRVSDGYTIGAEVLQHRFGDVGGVAGNDLDATTITLRGGIRF
tara:strand:+ start:1036 stop:1629 length:594 start_codon:yes stop_codon:yes gene_type:complete